MATIIDKVQRIHDRALEDMLRRDDCKREDAEKTQQHHRRHNAKRCELETTHKI